MKTGRMTRIGLGMAAAIGILTLARAEEKKEAKAEEAPPPQAEQSTKKDADFQEACRRIEVMTQGGKKPEPEVSQEVAWVEFTDLIQNTKRIYYLKDKITDFRSEKLKTQKATNELQVSAKYRQNKY